MRPSGHTVSHPAAASAAPAVTATPPQSDWNTLRRLFPYLWIYKWRVVAALAFMVGAKVANVGVPLLLKNLVDNLSIKPGDPTALLVVRDRRTLRLKLKLALARSGWRWPR